MVTIIFIFLGDTFLLFIYLHYILSLPQPLPKPPNFPKRQPANQNNKNKKAHKNHGAMKSETDSMYETCTSSYQTDPWSEREVNTVPTHPATIYSWHVLGEETFPVECHWYTFRFYVVCHIQLKHSVPVTANLGVGRWRERTAAFWQNTRIWPDTVLINTVNYREVVRQWLFFVIIIYSLIYLFLWGWDGKV